MPRWVWQHAYNLEDGVSLIGIPLCQLIKALSGVREDCMWNTIHGTELVTKNPFSERTGISLPFPAPSGMTTISLN